MSNVHARYGGTVVWTEARDTGGMFPATVGVEELPPNLSATNKFRAFAIDWHGGVQCFRPTLEEAKGEVERLLNRLH